MRGQYNTNGLERKTLSLPRLGTQETLWNKDAWERFVKEKEMGGIQLHFGGDQNFMATIKCDGIPRFMLIDREGKFIDSNMTRPSEAATWKTLEALPGL